MHDPGCMHTPYTHMMNTFILPSAKLFVFSEWRASFVDSGQPTMLYDLQRACTMFQLHGKTGLNSDDRMI